MDCFYIKKRIHYFGGYSERKNYFSFELYDVICFEDDGFKHYSVAEDSISTIVRDLKEGEIDKDSLLEIPEVSILELQLRFLNHDPWPKLCYRLIAVGKRDDPDFARQFHWFTEREQQVEAWQEFRESELEKFAIMWCKENGIKYSLKPEFMPRGAEKSDSWKMKLT
jgi:hypothetical protein